APRTSPPRVVVVGDVLLDRDVDGQVTRFSPDGPVPVVDTLGVRRSPGGAGLTALLAADDADVRLVAPFGDDRAGAELRALLRPHVDVVALPRWARRAARPACAPAGRPSSASTTAVPRAPTTCPGARSAPRSRPPTSCSSPTTAPARRTRGPCATRSRTPRAPGRSCGTRTRAAATPCPAPRSSRPTSPRRSGPRRPWGSTCAPTTRAAS